MIIVVVPATATTATAVVIVLITSVITIITDQRPQSPPRPLFTHWQSRHQHQQESQKTSSRVENDAEWLRRVDWGPHCTINDPSVTNHFAHHRSSSSPSFCSTGVPPTSPFGVWCGNALANGAHVIHLGTTGCDDDCALFVGLWCAGISPNSGRRWRRRWRRGSLVRRRRRRWGWR